MGSYEENFLAKRPQHLCHMCGKCCRVVTTSVPYPQLREMAKKGDKGARDFLSLFVPYQSIEAARKVDASIVDNIIMRLSDDGNYNEEEITFYGCKYLQPDNLCSRYDTRLKQKIRRSKEELIELQLLKKKTANPENLKKILSVEQKIQKNIDLYKKYGSEDW